MGSVPLPVRRADVPTHLVSEAGDGGTLIVALIARVRDGNRLAGAGGPRHALEREALAEGRKPLEMRAAIER